MRVEIRKALPLNVRNGVRLYAHVASRSRNLEHVVVFIRKAGMRRWLCDCEDFLFRGFSRRRHCEHIRAVRENIA